MTDLVIDASVAIKWVVDEPGTNEALSLVQHRLYAPDLLVPECANILWKKVRRGVAAANKAEKAFAQRKKIGTHACGMRVLDAAAQQQMFEVMGLELQANPAGWCGHAGSFGYEAEHYPVSVTIAEQALLPAVRSAGSDTLVIAEGFRCREQIRHGAGRNALHSVEVFELQRNERITSFWEVDQRLQQPPASVQPAASIPTLAALVVAGGMALWIATRSQSARMRG